MTRILIITALFFALAFNLKAQEYYVIVNSPENVTYLGISIEKIRKVFLGNEKKWNNNSIALCALNKDTSEEFFKNVISKSNKDYHDFWRRKLFSGNGIPPKELESDEDVIKFVTENKYAIGILNKKPEKTIQAPIVLFSSEQIEWMFDKSEQRFFDFIIKEIKK